MGKACTYRHTTASGYFVIRNLDDMLVVDCGEVGPDYQPGHAHCDTLSFELASDGRTIIVDSGVYDYEDSEMRRYVRSTRAHNTAMVDGCEQSEIWGAFRVARRARPIQRIDRKVRRVEGTVFRQPRWLWPIARPAGARAHHRVRDGRSLDGGRHLLRQRATIGWKASFICTPT